MAKNVIVDAGLLVAFLHRRDTPTAWAPSQAQHLPLPWHTCEAVLSETFHLVGVRGTSSRITLQRREAVVVSFELKGNLKPVLTLLQKYAAVPMSLADACLVRMTE